MTTWILAALLLFALFFVLCIFLHVKRRSKTIQNGQTNPSEPVLLYVNAGFASYENVDHAKQNSEYPLSTNRPNKELSTNGLSSANAERQRHYSYASTTMVNLQFALSSYHLRGTTYTENNSAYSSARRSGVSSFTGSEVKSKGSAMSAELITDAESRTKANESDATCDTLDDEGNVFDKETDFRWDRNIAYIRSKPDSDDTQVNIATKPRVPTYIELDSDEDALTPERNEGVTHGTHMFDSRQQAKRYRSKSVDIEISSYMVSDIVFGKEPHNSTNNTEATIGSSKETIIKKSASESALDHPNLSEFDNEHVFDIRKTVQNNNLMNINKYDTLQKDYRHYENAHMQLYDELDGTQTTYC